MDPVLNPLAPTPEATVSDTQTPREEYLQVPYQGPVNFYPYVLGGAAILVAMAIVAIVIGSRIGKVKL